MQSASDVSATASSNVMKRQRDRDRIASDLIEDTEYRHALDP